MTTYWINTVSRGHVQRGVAGGFTQANHGKPHMLRRMARDDWIVFYSPKTDYPTARRCRRSPRSAGRRRRGVPGGPRPRVPAVAAPGRVPAVRRDTHPATLEDLDFIENKARWGYRFRFGVFKIDDHDFNVIRTAMTG